MSRPFHELLADARPRRLSQADAAKVADVSRDAISRWERGEASPPTAKLAVLCALYELDDQQRLALFDAANPVVAS